MIEADKNFGSQGQGYNLQLIKKNAYFNVKWQQNFSHFIAYFSIAIMHKMLQDKNINNYQTQLLNTISFLTVNEITKLR